MTQLRQALRDISLPLAIGVALIAALVAAHLVAPGSLRQPLTGGAGAAVVLLAFVRWPRPTLVVFALFMLLADSFAIWIGSGVDYVDEVVVPGLVVIAAVRERPWRRGLIEPVRDGAFGVVVVLAVISSLINGVPTTTWLISLVLMAKSFAFLHVVLWHEWSTDDVRRALAAVFAVGLAVLTVGLMEAVVGPSVKDMIGLPRYADVRGILPGISSVIVFVTVFSWFMAFVALFLFAYYLVYRRLWLLVAGLAFGAAAFLAGRRRAIAGLMVGPVVGMVAQLRRGVARRTLVRVWLPIGGIALALVIFFAPGLYDLGHHTLDGYVGPLPDLLDPSLPTDPWDLAYYVPGNPRVLLYTTSAVIARDHFPLGAGLGRYGSPLSRDADAFSPLYHQYGLDHIWGLTPHYSSYILDTYWPHILGEAGVLALIGYLVYIGALGVSVWRATRTLDDAFSHAFALGALMAFVHALLESVASSMYESSPRIYLLFGAFAIALALARAAQRSHIARDVSAVEGAALGL
ncbi:MAG TPA: hypothetical protein VM284_03670 [Candidatus Limnocylindria bacterium]|nr:hypothetical protein [Candidatus Limnocylindria bacterium]